jgi:hypothetical protein
MSLRPLLCLLALAPASCRPGREAPPASVGIPDSGAATGFSIDVPHAGDTLVEGRTYVIRWHARPGMRINLGAVMGGKDKGYLLNNAPADPDSLVWTVPVGFVTGFGPLSSDQVRLRMENADSSDQWVEAGPFTITGMAQP